MSTLRRSDRGADDRLGRGVRGDRGHERGDARGSGRGEGRSNRGDRGDRGRDLRDRERERDRDRPSRDDRDRDGHGTRDTGRPNDRGAIRGGDKASDRNRVSDRADATRHTSRRDDLPRDTAPTTRQSRPSTSKKSKTVLPSGPSQQPLEKMNHIELVKPNRETHRGFEITAAEWSYNGARIAVSRTDGILVIWNVNKNNGDPTPRQPTVMKKLHEGMVTRIAWRPESDEILATIGKDRSIHIWNIVTGKLMHEIETAETTPVDIAYSPNAEYLAVITQAHTLVIYNANTYEQLQTLEYGKDGVSSLCWSNNSVAIFVGLVTGKISVVIKGGDGAFVNACILEGHRSRINSLCMDPRGRYIAAGSHEGIISLWSTTDLTLARTIGTVDQSIHRMDLFADGVHLGVTYQEADSAKIFNIETGKEVVSLPGCNSGTNLDGKFRFSPVAISYLYTNGDGSVFTGVERTN
ncbi:CYFA0S06e02784g1_1 [Cyberlindnera fabianii]|uniref:CYFA0S06e02784g1_1 n=1 Tax=Cyberlindnera fabianii TaxID=36022 RepID=A0A061AVE5_CYBFA|nr:CYFA0S06e02784g1_1 [Cyberlindnera fabianii]